MSVLHNRLKKPSKKQTNSPFFSRQEPSVVQIHEGLKFRSGIFIRLVVGQRPSFSSASLGKGHKKYTEETTKLHRPLEPKMYLLM